MFSRLALLELLLELLQGRRSTSGVAAPCRPTPHSTLQLPRPPPAPYIDPEPLVTAAVTLMSLAARHKYL